MTPDAASADRRNLQVLRAAVGLDYGPVGGRYSVQHRDSLAPRHAAGHQRGLGQAGGAVVHPGVGDLHPVQVADQRLELVDDLQRALAGLGLVGGVGGYELSAGDQRLDDGRDEVVVGASPQKRRAAAQRPVASSQRAQLPLDLQFRQRVWNAQGWVAVFGGDVGEEFVDG